MAPVKNKIGTKRSKKGKKNYKIHFTRHETAAACKSGGV